MGALTLPELPSKIRQERGIAGDNGPYSKLSECIFWIGVHARYKRATGILNQKTKEWKEKECHTCEGRNGF